MGLGSREIRVMSSDERPGTMRQPARPPDRGVAPSGRVTCERVNLDSFIELMELAAADRLSSSRTEAPITTLASPSRPARKRRMKCAPSGAECSAWRPPPAFPHCPTGSVRHVWPRGAHYPARGAVPAWYRTGADRPRCRRRASVGYSRSAGLAARVCCPIGLEGDPFSSMTS